MGEMTKDLSVLIYHNDTLVTQCKPKYVGMLGMILCPDSINFKNNTRLSVEFFLGEGEEKRLRMPAIVTSNNEQGLGLTFHPSDNDAINSLLDILIALPVQAVGSSEARTG